MSKILSPGFMFKPLFIIIFLAYGAAMARGVGTVVFPLSFPFENKPIPIVTFSIDGDIKQAMFIASKYSIRRMISNTENLEPDTYSLYQYDSVEFEKPEKNWTKFTLVPISGNIVVESSQTGRSEIGGATNTVNGYDFRVNPLSQKPYDSLFNFISKNEGQENLKCTPIPYTMELAEYNEDCASTLMLFLMPGIIRTGPEGLEVEITLDAAWYEGQRLNVIRFRNIERSSSFKDLNKVFDKAIFTMLFKSFRFLDED